jgi:hypothetical protein
LGHSANRVASCVNMGAVFKVYMYFMGTTFNTYTKTCRFTG